jgi:alpha-galactosidase
MLFSWNTFFCNESEELLLETAKKIVSYGLRDAGYEYIVLDDCCSAGRNSSGYLKHNSTKFPNGMAHVADQLHKMGLKFGMYSDAGTYTCGKYAGSLGYEQNDADLWLRVASTTLNTITAIMKASWEHRNLRSIVTKLWGKALNATGRPDTLLSVQLGRRLSLEMGSNTGEFLAYLR